MNNKDFAILCNSFAANEQIILNWKAKDYTDGKDDTDRLQNFKEVAAFIGLRPSEVALTYLLKHVQSIALAVKNEHYNWNWETKDGEGLKQRIADARNYLLLLAACIEEETGGSKRNVQ